jgi:hypothetical protein
MHGIFCQKTHIIAVSLQNTLNIYTSLQESGFLHTQNNANHSAAKMATQKALMPNTSQQTKPDLLLCYIGLGLNKSHLLTVCTCR